MVMVPKTNRIMDPIMDQNVHRNCVPLMRRIIYFLIQLVSHESIFVKLSEMTCQFASLVEQNRELDLMSSKTARQTLDFDKFDLPKRKRAALFSPQDGRLN